MQDRIRPRLSYANVIASIALFAALGGSAYATHTHKMGTQDLQNRAVTAPKVANNAVVPRTVRNNAVRPRHLQAGAVRTGKILDGAVTGAKVPDLQWQAQPLENGWNGSFEAARDVQGVVHLRGSVSAGTDGTITTLPPAMRPAEWVTVPALCRGAAIVETYFLGVVQIDDQGQVRNIEHSTDSDCADEPAVNVFLDGITFGSGSG